MHGGGGWRKGGKKMSWEKMNQIREAGVMPRRMIEFFVD